jgi:hypothetical protein
MSSIDSPSFSSSRHLSFTTNVLSLTTTTLNNSDARHAIGINNDGTADNFWQFEYVIGSRLSLLKKKGNYRHNIMKSFETAGSLECSRKKDSGENPTNDPFKQYRQRKDQEMRKITKKDPNH